MLTPMNLALTSKTPELSVELISNNTFLNLKHTHTRTRLDMWLALMTIVWWWWRSMMMMKYWIAETYSSLAQLKHLREPHDDDADDDDGGGGNNILWMWKSFNFQYDSFLVKSSCTVFHRYLWLSLAWWLPASAIHQQWTLLTSINGKRWQHQLLQLLI